MAWSCALLSGDDIPLIESLSAPSIPTVSHFHFLHLSNSSWSVARLAIGHEPLLDAIAASAIKTRKEERTACNAALATMDPMVPACRIDLSSGSVAHVLAGRSADRVLVSVSSAIVWSTWRSSSGCINEIAKGTYIGNLHLLACSGLEPSQQ